MKCTGCKYYQKSKVYGNHCICQGTKPCDIARNQTKYEHRKKSNKKRRIRYDKERITG